MQIWLDSINLNVIRKANALGILHGVTTNPSMLAKAHDPMQTIKTLLDVQEGPITVQVVAETAQEMIRQGMAIYNLSPRVLVKMPVTKEGLEAINYLSKNDIKTMATAIFDSRQAFLAASAGANYIAPYLSHMQKEDPDAIKQLQTMLKTIDYQRFPLSNF